MPVAVYAKRNPEVSYEELKAIQAQSGGNPWLIRESRYDGMITVDYIDGKHPNGNSRRFALVDNGWREVPGDDADSVKSKIKPVTSADSGKIYFQQLLQHLKVQGFKDADRSSPSTTQQTQNHYYSAYDDSPSQPNPAESRKPTLETMSTDSATNDRYSDAMVLQSSNTTTEQRRSFNSSHQHIMQNLQANSSPSMTFIGGLITFGGRNSLNTGNEMSSLNSDLNELGTILSRQPQPVSVTITEKWQMIDNATEMLSFPQYHLDLDYADHTYTYRGGINFKLLAELDKNDPNSKIKIPYSEMPAGIKLTFAFELDKCSPDQQHRILKNNSMNDLQAMLRDFKSYSPHETNTTIGLLESIIREKNQELQDLAKHETDLKNAMGAKNWDTLTAKSGHKDVSHQRKDLAIFKVKQAFEAMKTGIRNGDGVDRKPLLDTIKTAISESIAFQRKNNVLGTKSKKAKQLIEVYKALGGNVDNLRSIPDSEKYLREKPGVSLRQSS